MSYDGRLALEPTFGASRAGTGPAQAVQKVRFDNELNAR